MKQTLKIFGVPFDFFIYPAVYARPYIGEALGSVEKFDELYEWKLRGFLGLATCGFPRHKDFQVRAWGEDAATVLDLLQITAERMMGVL